MSELYPSRYITANGLRFHYVENGPEEGPPVLLLHGFPAFWYSWRYQLGALGQAGFRAIAPDLRGYNLSDKPIGVMSYTIDKLLDDVVALVKGLGYQKVTLIGHDWGGFIAWAVACSPRHQHVVEQLVVMNAPHPAAFIRNFSLGQLRKSWYMLLFQLPILPEHLFSRNSFSVLRQMLRGSAHVPGAFSETDTDHYVEALARPGALTSTINYYRALPRVNQVKLAKEVVPVAAPTLLVWGERDVALGKELTYGMSRDVPDLRIEYLPDSGHFVHEEQPEQVNRILLDFLKPPRPC